MNILIIKWIREGNLILFPENYHKYYVFKKNLNISKYRYASFNF